ncbi:RusA family crossover junction endodeoxyribonuclease [Brumimicrobium oceani]|uniref:Uncharacterized protein n=1 Tax=Brumimicrobium oceani TaxID=2100725 RepID=A0A2U2XG74_9FLAO|nr:RusA family crossover junction endodeoxyribonuclease [Brumimicrobium oceani]PWH86757.1 hypothetical protein DIT68_00380 [Brumimicrobium oceani]
MKKQQLNINQPPEYGELNLSFNFEPVSLQSKPAKKELLKSEIRKITSTLNYLLTGDLKIEIQWEVHEQERYENPNSPDIDNILKVILDSLSSSNGVIIDDCQVQAVASHWIDSYSGSHKINISIKYHPEEYTTKNNLVFVHLGENLYFPMHSNHPLNVKLIMTEQLERMMILRDKLVSETKDYYQANQIIPIQRVFHKSRVVDNFQTMEINEYLLK